MREGGALARRAHRRNTPCSQAAARWLSPLSHAGRCRSSWPTTTATPRAPCRSPTSLCSAWCARHAVPRMQSSAGHAGRARGTCAPRRLCSRPLRGGQTSTRTPARHAPRHAQIHAKLKGCVVFTSSAAAAMPSPFSVLYAATKSFLGSFGAGLAAEVRGGRALRGLTTTRDLSEAVALRGPGGKRCMGSRRAPTTVQCVLEATCLAQGWRQS